MRGVFRDRTGQKIGPTWRVVDRAYSGKSPDVKWNCVCEECGAEAAFYSNHIETGSFRTCECFAWR